MNLYKIFLLKLILFIGQRTFLGRGIIRKKLVRLIEFIIFSNDHQNLSNYKFICKILGVPFYFIFVLKIELINNLVKFIIVFKLLFFTQSEKILHEAWHIRQDSVLYDIFLIIFLLIFRYIVTLSPHV